MTIDAPREGENKWVRAIRTYWSDPANVIGPPGAFIRRMFKFWWLVLSIYVLLFIAGPSQVSSWRLWMEDDQLAEHIAWGFTLGSALCFAVVGYAAEVTQPLRVPLLLPSVEFEERRYKGWHIKPVHLHLPSVRVLLGSLLCLGLFSIALLGMYNFYLHEQQRAGGASVAALEGSTDRVAEAQRALDEHDRQTAGALAVIDQGISETSAGSPTGRSRLVNQRTALMTEAGAERRRLQAELREARAATVDTHQTFADPRPVDAQVASITGADRSAVASTLDLLRSGVVELMLVMGAGLGLAGATSRIGVPAQQSIPRETINEEETVSETPPAEPDPAPAPPPRRRFTLPSATEVDLAVAAVVGPVERVSASPLPDEPAPVEESVAQDDAEYDPLLAERLNNTEALEPEHV